MMGNSVSTNTTTDYDVKKETVRREEAQRELQRVELEMERERMEAMIEAKQQMVEQARVEIMDAKTNFDERFKEYRASAGINDNPSSHFLAFLAGIWSLFSWESDAQWRSREEEKRQAYLDMERETMRRKREETRRQIEEMQKEVADHRQQTMMDAYARARAQWTATHHAGQYPPNTEPSDKIYIEEIVD